VRGHHARPRRSLTVLATPRQLVTTGFRWLGAKLSLSRSASRELPNGYGAACAMHYTRGMGANMNTTDRDILRRCRFAPYRKGMGPKFYLTTWDTGRQDQRGQTIIGYRLLVTQAEYPSLYVVVFEAEDFAGSPMHADDSDECVRSLMTFLTLCPGDTDADYFENYTDDQRAFCAQHAEALSMYVMNRFGEER